MHATWTGRSVRPSSSARPSVGGAEHRSLTYNPFVTQPLTSSGYASSPLVNPTDQLRERQVRRHRAAHSASLAPRGSLSDFTRVASPPPIDTATAPARLPRGGEAARRPSRLALTAPAAPARDTLTADLRGAPQHIVPHRADGNTLTLSLSQHPTHYTASPYLSTIGRDPAGSRSGVTRPGTPAAQPKNPSGYRWTFLTDDAIADGRRLRASVRPPKAPGGTTTEAETAAPEEEEEPGLYRLKEALLAPSGAAAPSGERTERQPSRRPTTTATTSEAPIDGVLSFEDWLQTVHPPTGSAAKRQARSSDASRRTSAQALGSSSQQRAEKMARAYEALLEEMADQLPYTRHEDRERLLRLKDDFAHHSLRLQCAYRHLPSRVVPAEEPEPCSSASPALTASNGGHRRPPRAGGYTSMLQPMLPAWERTERLVVEANAVLAQVKDPHTTTAPTALTTAYGDRPDMHRLLQEHEAAALEAEELERARERSFYETLNRYSD